MEQHPILKYIESRGLSQTDFARLAGLSIQHLNDVVRRGSHLGRKRALEVVRVTGGAISLEALMTWESEEDVA